MMKKVHKTFLITAGILIAAGVIISASALALGAGRSANGDVAFVEEEITADDIAIYSELYGIELETTDTDRITLIRPESAELEYSGGMEDDTFKAELKSKRGRLIWLERLNFWGGDRNEIKLVLRVPAFYSGSIALEADSGDIEVTGFGGDMSLKAALGNIDLKNCGADTERPGAVDISCDAGDINIVNGVFGGLECRNGLGDASLDNVASNGTYIALDAGDIEISGGRFESLECKNGLGDIVMNSVASNSIAAESDSGEISGETVSAAEIKLFGNMGDIEIRGVEGANIYAETQSGDIDLSVNGAENDYIVNGRNSGADTAGKNIINASAGMGDVNIEFLN